MPKRIYSVDTVPAISFEQSIGMTVKATTSEAMSAIIMVQQKSAKINDAIPSESAIGKNTSTVVRVDATTARKISLEALFAATIGSGSSCLILKMSSSTTMELSTSIPTQIVSAHRVIRFKVISSASITAKAASRDVGMDRAMMSVVLTFLRKRKTTIMASSAPMIADSATERMEDFI